MARCHVCVDLLHNLIYLRLFESDRYEAETQKRRQLQSFPSRRQLDHPMSVLAPSQRFAARFWRTDDLEQRFGVILLKTRTYLSKPTRNINDLDVC